MRSIVAFLLGLAAVMCAAAAIPALWTERHVVNEDGYVSFVEPLGSDPKFTAAVADQIAGFVVSRSSLSERAGQVVRPAIAGVARRITNLDGYPQAWAESNRLSHRSLFADARRLPPDVDQSDRLSIDIGPLARLVVDEVNARTSRNLSAPSQIVVGVGGNNERPLIDDAKFVGGKGYPLTIAALVLAAAAILVARRRSSTAAWLGVGLLAVAGLLKLVAEGVVPAVVDRNTPPGVVGREFVTLVQDLALSSFSHWLLVVGVSGAALVVIGGASRVIAGRTGRSPEPVG